MTEWVTMWSYTAPSRPEIITKKVWKRIVEIDFTK